jgi:TPR repeat protein
MIEQVKKRIKVDDAEAIRTLGCCYFNGRYGLTRNYAKGLELWHRASKLGNAKSYCSIGYAYYEGNGVERDEKKARHYYELASIGGDIFARYNLGNNEARAGNYDRAMKHYMIAAGFGNSGSLEQIKLMFMNGHATKDDYAKALRAYQANLVEIKSPQREEAAAAYEDYKYY